jgi:lipoyl synthase
MERKPKWLHQERLPVGEKASGVLAMIRSHDLKTVCTEASCPNKGKCFSEGTATFLILGPNCTRNCAFCNIGHGNTLAEDLNEAERVAEAAKQMGLDFVVVTSVTRDDLADQGANAFARTIITIRKKIPSVKVEVLIPDFEGRKDLLKIVLDEKPDVFNHNIETVRRLTPLIRSKADYERSLSILKMAREINPKQITKSGLIVGVGEEKAELIETFKDLAGVSVDRLTIGQYLPPSRKHFPVKKYYTPEEFHELKEEAINAGIKGVLSGPFVRSSFHAAGFE